MSAPTPVPAARTSRPGARHTKTGSPGIAGTPRPRPGGSHRGGRGLSRSAGPYRRSGASLGGNELSFRALADPSEGVDSPSTPSARRTTEGGPTWPATSPSGNTSGCASSPRSRAKRPRRLTLSPTPSQARRGPPPQPLFRPLPYYWDATLHALPESHRNTNSGATKCRATADSSGEARQQETHTKVGSRHRSTETGEVRPPRRN
jgi:hypothetical protein